MARMRSFFTALILPSYPGPVPEAPRGQTVSRSRAPVSDDGCRSLDMARASI